MASDKKKRRALEEVAEVFEEFASKVQVVRDKEIDERKEQLTKQKGSINTLKSFTEDTSVGILEYATHIDEEHLETREILLGVLPTLCNGIASLSRELSLQRGRIRTLESALHKVVEEASNEATERAYQKLKEEHGEVFTFFEDIMEKKKEEGAERKRIVY